MVIRPLVSSDADAAARVMQTALPVPAPFDDGHRLTVHVDLMTSGQDWAVRTCLDARLALSADGPLFTRGELGPLRPWLPSGALL